MKTEDLIDYLCKELKITDKPRTYSKSPERVFERLEDVTLTGQGVAT
jgi:hypothetical protein